MGDHISEELQSHIAKGFVGALNMAEICDLRDCLSVNSHSIFRTQKGQSLLHLTVKLFDSDHEGDKLVLDLLKRGCDPNGRDDQGDTPLIAAIKNDNAEAVTILLNHGADVTMKNNEGKGPLHLVKCADYFAMTEEIYQAMLIEKAMSQDDIVKAFIEADVPLYVVPFTKNIELIKIIHRHRGDVNERDESSEEKYTAFSSAVYAGCLEAMHCLLELGARVDETMLYEALWTSLLYEDHSLDHKEIIQVLLDHEADVYKLDLPALKLVHEDSPFELDKLLLRHVAKLEVLGQPMSSAFVGLLDEFKELAVYLDDCRLEIDSMRHERVYGRVTIFHLLTASVETMACYARNERLQEDLARSEYVGKCPLYRDLLERNVRRGMERKQQLQTASEKLKGCMLFRLIPDEIMEKMLNLLNIVDLHNINCL